MPEFPIIKLDPEKAETIEQLGSKPKFWFQFTPQGPGWLFKYSRENTGEDWSEKIGAEIANLLGLPYALVHLAEISGNRGTISRSFVAEGFDLVHGNEILSGYVHGYDPTKQRKQCDHTFAAIVAAFYQIFSDPRARQEALETLAGYFVLDGIICNTDRHHENWALLRSTTGAGETAIYRIAPTFDHASSLGRELLDEKRLLLLKQNGISSYVRKGRGAIYWGRDDAHGMNPLEFSLKASRIHTAYFGRWIERVKRINSAALEPIVLNVPEIIMSRVAKDFTMRILLHTVNELKQIST